MTVAVPPMMTERALPRATISPDQFRAFADHVEAAGGAVAGAGSDPLAVFVARVRPFALATLAALLDHAEDAIGVLDEAQFRGRCVALTPRPDGGYSLSIAKVRDDAAAASHAMMSDPPSSRYERA